MSMNPREGEILSQIIEVLAKRDDALAEKLRDVVEALVAADDALATRINQAEALLQTLGNPALGPSDTYRLARESYFPDEPSATQPYPPAEVPPTRVPRVLRWLWSPPARH